MRVTHYHVFWHKNTHSNEMNPWTLLHNTHENVQQNTWLKQEKKNDDTCFTTTHTQKTSKSPEGKPKGKH